MQNRPTGRSRKRTRRKKGGCGPALLAGFIFLAAGCGAGFLYGKYLKPGTVMADKRDVFQIKGNQVALILDNELQEAKGIYEDGQVYLPVDWVDDYVNQRFYWDDGEKLLVYALPEEIVYADESTEGEAGPLLKEKDGETYLSLGLVKNYTDIREEAFATSEIKRVFIDTNWDTYEAATLRYKTSVRVKGGIRSEIINTEEKGTSVQIIEQMDKWSKVRTEDGYMGYVPNSRLSKVEEETPVSEFNAPVYTNISMDGKVRLGFHQVTTKDANATFDKVADTAQGMNVIVPTWFNITDNEGNYTSLASKDYVDKAHALGIQVWAMFDNISTEESVKNVDSGKLFSSTATRKKLIENLSNNVSRAYIGIRGQDVTEELSDKTGIPKGVLISRVADDSPAMMAGMKEYDVIVKLGEHKVETIKQYHEQLGKYSTGDVVTVTAMRKGAEGYAEMTFDVTMGEV